MIIKYKTIHSAPTTPQLSHKLRNTIGENSNRNSSIRNSNNFNSRSNPTSPMSKRKKREVEEEEESDGESEEEEGEEEEEDESEEGEEEGILSDIQLVRFICSLIQN